MANYQLAVWRFLIERFAQKLLRKLGKNYSNPLKMLITNNCLKCRGSFSEL